MPKDILQNTDNCDIRLANSGDIYDPVFDIQYGESTEQHQRDILLCDKGEVRQTPSVGAGIVNFLESENADGLLREVRVQSGMDKMKIITLRWPSFPNGKIQYHVKY